MDVLPFSTDSLPQADRLAAFRRGATDFRVDAIGDPLAFAAQWRLLVTGEINLIESRISPVHYRRTRDDIAADGKDRVAVLMILGGEVVGTINDQPIRVGPGDAMVFDLLRPLDTRAAGPLHTLIATMPRFILEEVLPLPLERSSMGASAELALAVAQIRYLLGHAAGIGAESGMFHGLAVCDLIARALLPATGNVEGERERATPLLARVHEIIDARLLDPPPLRTVAEALGTTADAVRAITERAGSWSRLIEQRRLIAAYRLLCLSGGALSIGAIAARSGFGSGAHFSRRFRQAFGAAPSDVRARHLGDLPAWAGSYHVAVAYRELLCAPSNGPEPDGACNALGRSANSAKVNTGLV